MSALTAACVFFSAFLVVITIMSIEFGSFSSAPAPDFESVVLVESNERRNRDNSSFIVDSGARNITNNCGTRDHFAPLRRSFSPLSVDDIVVAVVTSGPRQNQTFAAINKTWGSEFPHIYYFTSIQPIKPMDINVRVVETRKDYVRNSWEFMIAHKVIFEEHPNASFFFICGDDAWVHVPRLLKFASLLDSSKLLYYGAPHFGSRFAWHCGGGCGYLVSNALMRKVQQHILEPFHRSAYGFSDAQFGFLVKNYFNVSCNAGPGFFNTSHHVYLNKRGLARPPRHGPGHSQAELLAPIAYHYIGPEDQFVLDLFFRYFDQSAHLVWKSVNLTTLSKHVLPDVDVANFNVVVPQSQVQLHKPSCKSTIMPRDINVLVVVSRASKIPCRDTQIALWPKELTNMTCYSRPTVFPARNSSGALLTENIKWYLILHGDMWLHSPRFLAFVSEMDSESKLLLGAPVNNGSNTYCSMKSGILLSRGFVRELRNITLAGNTSEQDLSLEARRIGVDCLNARGFFAANVAHLVAHEANQFGMESLNQSILGALRDPITFPARTVQKRVDMWTYDVLYRDLLKD